MKGDKLNRIIKRSNRALAKAERLYGSASALAKKIGVSRQCVSYWKSEKILLPYDKAIKIFVTTRGKISVCDLRPDLKFLTQEFRDVVLERPNSL